MGAQVARLLGVSTSAVVRAANYEELPEVENYLQVNPETTSVFTGRSAPRNQRMQPAARPGKQACAGAHG